MLSEIVCECVDKSSCGGKITTTELKMEEMDPRWSAVHYHEVSELFIKAFSEVNR